MNVLVACEESQRVCMAFREKGHKAFSCDVQPCSGGHPEWHIQGDALKLINGNVFFLTSDGKCHDEVLTSKWDLLIAHPPCTYLTVTGNRWFNVERYGDKALRREREREEAAEFFMKFVKADCDHIAIENPVGYMSTHFLGFSQIIQPYMFGSHARKTTCLWLKGLPKLEATEIVEPELLKFVAKNGKVKSFSADYGSGNKGHGKRRSKTYPGIAKAMAEQWTEERINGLSEWTVKGEVEGQMMIGGMIL